MAREEMNITAKYLKLDIAGVSIVKVKNIAQVRCTLCDKSSVNMLMLKKHYKEAHTWERQTLSLDANSRQQRQSNGLMKEKIKQTITPALDGKPQMGNTLEALSSQQTRKEAKLH